MPVIGENIILASTQPNFSRDSVKTISDLKNAKIKHYDVGHIVYCTETDKHYIFKGTEVVFDSEIGYFRLFDSSDAITDTELDDLLNDLEITPLYPDTPASTIKFLEQLSKGGDIILENNIKLENAEIVAPTNINLNNKSIFKGQIIIMDSLVINGDGSVSSQFVVNNELYINGGNYSSYQEPTFILNSGGSVHIHGGVFDVNRILFEKSDESELFIYGGTYNIDPTEWLAEGYAAVLLENDLWEVSKINQ